MAGGPFDNGTWPRHLPDQVVVYGAPSPIIEPIIPWNPQPITPFLPFSPSTEEIARMVLEAMKSQPGKVDPPPSEAHRELDAIKALVTALESLDALVKSLATQLTAEEKARVLRYMKDRYGNLPVFGVVEESSDG